MTVAKRLGRDCDSAKTFYNYKLTTCPNDSGACWPFNFFILVHMMRNYHALEQDMTFDFRPDLP